MLADNVRTTKWLSRDCRREITILGVGCDWVVEELSTKSQPISRQSLANPRRVANGDLRSNDFAVPSNPKRNPLNPDSHGRVAYRLREASEMTGIPVSTFRTMARRGEFNPITSFGVWLIAAEELEALLQKRLRNTRG